MTTAELDQLVSQKTSILGMWQHILCKADNMSMKNLSVALTKYVFNEDQLLKISEIEKLQVALYICTFYNNLHNEETAQNVVTLLLDNANKVKECEEFLSFLTSVAASGQVTMYLQTLGIVAKHPTTIHGFCQKVITDNCVSSKSYPELYKLASSTPLFTVLLLSYCLKEVNSTVRNKKKINKSLVELTLHWLKEYSYTDQDMLQSVLFFIITVPSYLINVEPMFDEVFKTLFMKLLSKEIKVTLNDLKDISNHIAINSVNGKLCQDRMNQIVLIVSHQKISTDRSEEIASILCKTEFGELLSKSLIT